VSYSSNAWWNARRGEVHNIALQYVRQVDSVQSHIFDRFLKLEALYDMNPRGNAYADPRADGRMTENVIASNVDTVAAQIATTDVRATFDTDGADWSEQRRARHREWYAEQMAKLLHVAEKCQHGFKAGGAVKGTGLNKVYVDAFNEIRVDAVMVDDIVVDELECRNGPPRQMHHRTPVDRDELKAMFPDKAALIDRAQGGIGNWRNWAGWRPLQRNELVVIESWRLPIGRKGHERYVAGRHTIVIDQADLLDEEYHKPGFPFAVFRWSKPVQGWYGIGLAERIAGVQRALNRRNLQIERQLDQGAFPTTFVPLIDAALGAKTTFTTAGNITAYKGGQPPTTVIPQAVSPETYRDADRLSSKASEISGVSRLAAQSVKPAGIETGVALREYRDQTTQRFAMQEKDYETFFLDTIVLILDCCKDLGDAAPEVQRKTRFGAKKLSWRKVDMRDVRIQIGAASTLSRTRAGREQTVIEWAQAGIISQDSAKRLLQHPDLEREMSLYTAAIENVEHCLEEIADGNVVMPEPFMNLKLLIWRAQQQYLNWSADGAPEEVLENLRQLIVQAAWMESGGQQPGMGVGELGGPTAPGPDTSMPADAAGGMEGPPPGAPLPMAGPFPVGPALVPALAPPATLQLQAGM
jgi:hypothetical protein